MTDLALFIAPNSSSSGMAVENIRRALERFEAGTFALETVDVFAAPARALHDRVLVTPTLLAPHCGRRVVGDLNDASLLDYFLQALLNT